MHVPSSYPWPAIHNHSRSCTLAHPSTWTHPFRGSLPQHAQVGSLIHSYTPPPHPPPSQHSPLPAISASLTPPGDEFHVYATESAARMAAAEAEMGLRQARLADMTASGSMVTLSRWGAAGGVGRGG